MSLCFLRRASAFACLAFSYAAPSLDARSFSVVAYNVENLHDVDGVAVYEDYQPGAWTNEHLRVKLANTVAVHRTNVMTTLGLHKAAELVLFAVKHGLVEAP